MFNKFFNSFALRVTIRDALLITILLIPSPYALATEVQGISCVNKHMGATKHIYIEYLDSKMKSCRTIYSTDGSQSKAIAWARKNTQICIQVANNLAAKLGNSGWNCNAPRKTVRKVKFKTRPKIVRSHSEDELLNSIEK
jgi:hypothetical protein